jgi:hypothetical protein
MVLQVRGVVDGADCRFAGGQLRETRQPTRCDGHCIAAAVPRVNINPVISSCAGGDVKAQSVGEADHHISTGILRRRLGMACDTRGSDVGATRSLPRQPEKQGEGSRDVRHRPEAGRPCCACCAHHALKQRAVGGTDRQVEAAQASDLWTRQLRPAPSPHTAGRVIHANCGRASGGKITLMCVR